MGADMYTVALDLVLQRVQYRVLYCLYCRVSIVGLFFKTLAGLSLFFPTKIVSVVLKDQK